METAAVKQTNIKAPKVGTKPWIDYKSATCDLALSLKKKMDKTAAHYGEVIAELEKIFEKDSSQYFSKLGNVKKEITNSYSIDEKNVEEAVKLLNKNKLVIDTYIIQKTGYTTTAKLKALAADESPLGQKLNALMTIKTSSRISVKTS